jgi:hypothetical protein
MSPTRLNDELPEYEYPKGPKDKRTYECPWPLRAIYFANIGLCNVVEYADLAYLDISKLDQPGGKEALAQQVLSFINTNGIRPAIEVQGL